MTYRMNNFSNRLPICSIAAFAIALGMTSCSGSGDSSQPLFEGQGGEGGAAGMGGETDGGAGAGGKLDGGAGAGGKDDGGAGAGGKPDAGGDGATDLCAKVECDGPPANACSSTNELRTYGAQGTCSNGICSYPTTLVPCPFGCAQGHCVEDPCKGIACSTPPANICKDTASLTTSEPTGTCSKGVCSYVTKSIVCPSGCENGHCKDDPCMGVTCSTPPSKACKDASTLRTFNASGSCAAGLCSYAPTDLPCNFGCEAAACKNDPCAGMTCSTPPANHCVDASTLGGYASAGTCTSGVCGYSPTTLHCDFGCEAGACKGDSCIGVTCKTPPATSCLDANNLKLYSATGTCSQGVCTYSSSTQKCTFGCDQGKCNGDPCSGVTCQTPPANTCTDANTLKSYGSGSCSAGVCSYSSSLKTCTYGCDQGKCNSNPCANVTCTTPPKNACKDNTTLQTYTPPGTCSLGLCSYIPKETICPYYCENGQCRGYCLPGSKRCIGNATQTCTDQYNWGTPALCGGAIPTCSQGQCVSTVSGERITAGSFFTCAVTPGGEVKCWGKNDRYQLGNGLSDNSSVPVAVSQPTANIVSISAGHAHVCELIYPGQVKCWGDNNLSQADGWYASAHTPTLVVSLANDMVAVAVGGNHSCSLAATGGVWCWGDNEHGAIGPDDAFRQVRSLSDWTYTISAIQAGGMNTCALTVDGAVECVGYNKYGQLGNNSSYEDSFVPVSVSGLTKNVTAISTGDFHSCALTTAGGVKCWGANYYGQLGNNSTTDHFHVPVDVTGLSSGVVAISIGWGSSCALTSAGAVKCWGLNTSGQLGNNSTSNSRVPVSVSGLSSGVAAIAVGSAHACAYMSSGDIKCWGENLTGELGDGTTNNSRVPVSVIGF